MSKWLFSIDKKNYFTLMDFLQKSSGEFKVWKLRKFTVTFFCQKFRENNVFTKENTNELL